MNELIINIVNGKWVVSVSNTNISYDFLGDTLEAQAVNVQAFAQAMANGNANMRGFLYDTGDMPPGALENQLFGSTQEIVYMGDALDVDAEHSIMDELVDAGEILLEAIG